MAGSGASGLLAGEKVRLRALEPEDVDILYAWENDPRVWGVSGTLAPFSHEILREFIENQKYDIYRTRQLRLVICRVEEARKTAGSVAKAFGAADEPVGFMDLFDFDPVNLRAGVGILIFDEAYRGKGYAREALELMCGYAVRILRLHQLYATVETDNIAGESLFRGANFAKVGVLRDWSRKKGVWQDEIVFQRVFQAEGDGSVVF